MPGANISEPKVLTFKWLNCVLFENGFAIKNTSEFAKYTTNVQREII